MCIRDRLDPPALFPEEHDSQLALERAHRLAQPLLRDEEVVGSLRERSAFGDFQEVLEDLDAHTYPLTLAYGILKALGVLGSGKSIVPVSYTHLDVYKRQRR